MVSEELLILASCLLRPMSRNSVLEEFSVRRFAVIQDKILEHCEGDLCWSRSESEATKERAECHLRTGEQEEMRVLRGVVYMTKSGGPRQLGDTAGGCVPRREASFTYDTKAAR